MSVCCSKNDIDDLLFELFNIVYVEKIKNPNPNKLRTFLVLEKLLSKDIFSVIKPDQDKAIKSIKNIISSTTFDKLTPKLQRKFTDNVLKVIKKYGLNASKIVPPVLLEHMSDLFKQTKKFTNTDLKLDTVFNAKDKKAIKFIAQNNNLFIKTHWQDNVTKTASKIIKSNFEELGGDSKVLAKELSNKLGNIIQDKNYWETFANISLNTSRSYSNILSFDEAGITTYEIVNPMDERTSKICRILNGKVFEVSRAIKMFEKYGNASNRDEIKEVKPFLGYKNSSEEGFIEKPNGKRVFFDKKTPEQDLMDLGISVPPYHGRCRTTIVVG